MAHFRRKSKRDTKINRKFGKERETQTYKKKEQKNIVYYLISLTTLWSLLFYSGDRNEEEKMDSEDSEDVGVRKLEEKWNI